MTVETDGQDRKLGFWTCTALVVGNTIGIGIFLLPASLAPYGLNAMLGWVCGDSIDWKRPRKRRSARWLARRS